MTKEEKIKEAWDLLYEKYKERISLEDGYLYFKSNKVLKEVRQFFGEIEFPQWGGVSIFRPKSLQGIEDNNGWIKIESEEDLPIIVSDCYFKTIDSDFVNIGYYHPLTRLFEDRDFTYRIDQVSHYQPIVKPKPLVY